MPDLNFYFRFKLQAKMSRFLVLFLLAVISSGSGALMCLLVSFNSVYTLTSNTLKMIPN